MFKLGLIINPFAGVGGRVGLKGSDGLDVREQALKLGAKKLANTKAEIALNELKQANKSFAVYTISGEMGEQACQHLNIEHQVVYQAPFESTCEDTKAAVKALQKEKVDLILFAGGDGTARDIYASCNDQQLVLGIPAGVKIHSGVYAISPKAAGKLVKLLIQGEMMSLFEADVMDIDETAFRQGKVKAKKYGDLHIPAALQYVQATKSGGVEHEELVLADIAAFIIEEMDDDTYYVVGSGTTCAAVMDELGLDNTLLGSDIIFQQEIFCQDAIEVDILKLLEAGEKVKFIITVIGGQGHILGRGNHQLSPQVIQKAGWSNFDVIATKSKLKALDGRPLIVDTGNPQLDKALSGTKSVITGYKDSVVYQVGFETN